MKTLKFKLLAAWAAVGLALSAPAQVTPSTIYSLTNFPATVAIGATSVTTNIVPLTKNCGFSLQGIFNSTSTSTNGSTVVQGSFSQDGTNFGTAPFTLIWPSFGVTNQVVLTNWQATQLIGYAAVNFTTLTNGTGGILTNKNFTVSRVSFY